jgi:hypothetical protein
MSSKALVLIPAVLGMGIAAYFAFGSSGTPTPKGGGQEGVLEDTPLIDVEGEAVRSDAPRVNRERSEESGAPVERRASTDEETEVMAWAERSAELVLKGRVVDAGGRGISGAQVGVWMRPQMPENPGEMMRGGRGQPGGQGGRNNQDWRRMRDLFRMKKAESGTKTDGEGRYEIALSAFPRTNFEIGVQHSSFAPNTLAQDWNKEEGAIQVEPIELKGGGRAFGQVFDDNGAPIEGAEVVYQPQGQDQQRGPGGGPGARGRRGGPFGGSSVMRELLPETKTNNMGQFELTQLPPGSFRVQVEAPRYYDGRSETLELLEGASLKVPDFRLELGASVSGIVRDDKGQPVADARVSVRVSMQTLFQQMREQRENQQGQQAPGNARNVDMGRMRDLMRRGGGRGGRGQEVRTNKQGEFKIEGLVKAPLRIDVRKGGFLNYEEEPIEPAKRGFIEVQLERALSIRGVVTDLRGTPIETFGFRARRVWSGNDRGRGGRGDMARNLRDRFNRGGNQQQDPERQAQRDAAQAQRDAERQAREARLKSRFGGSGEIPRRTGKAEKHEGGQFVAENLQPGSYVIDIAAPGFIPIAAGPFELEQGKSLPVQTIRLEAGNPIVGVVLSGRGGEPVANARVRISLPPESSNSNQDDPFAQMRARFGRGGPGGNNRGQRVDEARTNAEGRFELQPQRPGQFVLEVQAEGHDSYVNDNFRVAGKAELTIEMDAAAILRGTVRGLVAGQRYVVAARHDKGRTYNANVDAETGAYVFESLPSGSYFVELRKQGDRSSWVRGMLRGTDPNQQPDVTLPPGGERTFNLNAQSDEFGTLSGILLVNGSPTAGYSISLQKVQQPGEASDPASRMIERRLLGRLLRDDTDAEGRFEVKSIPAGTYRVTVERSRGGGRGMRGRFGGGGGTALHSEEIVFATGSRVQRNFAVSVGSISVEFVVPGQTEPMRRARVRAVRADEGRNVEPSKWGELASQQRMRLQNGKVEADPFPTGTWLMLVEGRVGDKNYSSGVVELTVVGGKLEKRVELAEVAGSPQGAGNPQGGGGGR